MKISSPFLYISLAALVLAGCDNKKSAETLAVGVTNSYLFHTEPELLPIHKLIKQQRITGQGDKVISYNDQGYVASYDLQNLHAEVNYETAKYLYQQPKNKFEYSIVFDDTKNILGMKNNDKEIVASADYDDQDHLIETTLSHFTGDNVIFRSQIIYNQNNQVDQIIYKAYIPIDDKTTFPIFSREKAMVYDSDHRLAQTIVKTFKLTSNGEIVINQKNEQEVESTETCTYSAYNENDDWTKAQCVTVGEEPKTVDLVRTLDYLP